MNTEHLDEEQAGIKDYLKTVPYEILLQQRKALLQTQNKHQQSRQQSQKRSETAQQNNKGQQGVKRNRHAPIEKSAKQKVSRFKVVFKPHRVHTQVKQKKGLDPRFQSYAGKLNPTLAQSSFSFIQTMQRNQKNVLKKSLSSKKITPQEKDVLQKRYNQVTDAIKSNQMRNIQKEVVRENKKQIKQNREAGKKVFFKTKKIIKDEVRQKKLQKMSDKQFGQLMKQKSGKVEARLKHKRKQYIHKTN